MWLDHEPVSPGFTRQQGETNDVHDMWLRKR